MSAISQGKATTWRAGTLATIILVQALCAVFFFGDIVTDYMEGGHLDDIHLIVEAAATLGLVAGVYFLMRELRAILDRMGRMEAGLRAARGRMAEVIDAFFQQWGLSAAERDVALLILKGFDNDTIAGLRNTASGTVRAQTSAVYAKAGVDGRAQFVSLFLDELLADTLDPPQR